MQEADVQKKHREDSEVFESTQTFARENECECGGGLVLVHVSGEGDDPDWEAVCSNDRAHKGTRSIMTTIDAYRGGTAVPVHTANAIERKRPIVRDVATMAAIWGERNSKLTRAGATQAAIYSLQVGLDPRFGEIAVIEFGQEIKVPVVMITETGWQRLAFRECPDKLVKAPVIVVVMNADEKEQYGAPTDAWVALAVGRLRGDLEEGLPLRQAIGFYTRAERDKDKNMPAGKDPLNQARTRASRHWYEDNLPEAVERARAAWSATIEQLDLDGAEAVIEGEFIWSDHPKQSDRPKQAESSKANPTYPGTSGERRPANTTSQPGEITQPQINLILHLAQKVWGHDKADVDSALGYPLEEMTKEAASKQIGELKAMESEGPLPQEDDRSQDDFASI